MAFQASGFSETVQVTVGAEIDLSVDQCRRAVNFLLQVDVVQDLAVAVRGHHGQAATLVDQVDLSVACHCLLYTSPSPRDGLLSRMPSSA